MAGVRRHDACGVAAFARTSLARGYAGLCECARCRYAMTSATSSLVLRQVLVNWSFRGARAAQASVRSLRKLGCVPAGPESITTRGYGFRLSSRLGRNDEPKGTIAASLELCSVSEGLTLRTCGGAVRSGTKRWNVF